MPCGEQPQGIVLRKMDETEPQRVWGHDAGLSSAAIAGGQSV